MSALVYAWPGCEALARALICGLGAEAGALEVRAFPDGETYVRLGTPPDGRAVVLACGLESADAKCNGIAFAAATARELGAASVGLAAPYLAYMRQDARFHPGEAVASRLFAKWLSGTVDWLATVEPHLHRHATLSEIYSIPTRVASATGAIAAWIAANVPDPVVVGPDAESAQWAEAVATAAGCPSLVLTKQRHGDRDVEVALPRPLRDTRRTPVLVDDIISTGRTLAAAARLLRSAGLPAPVCVGVHALFSDDAEAALAAAGVARVATCNTIVHASNAIDVRAALVAAARELLDAAPSRRAAPIDPGQVRSPGA